MTEGIQKLVREGMSALIMKGGNPSEDDKLNVQSLLKQWVEAGGAKEDVVVMMAQSVYDVKAEYPEPEKKKMPPPVRIEFDWLESFMRDVLIGYGVPEDEAKVASDVLITADKRGIDSHGIGRLKPIYCDRMNQGILTPTQPITVVKETETTAVVDGNTGLGLYIGPKCMEMAIAKAKKYGMGMVVTKNSTHYGAACYYTLMANEAGCIGITGTNARPSIAPTFGTEPMLGTNPLTWGFPSDDPFPFSLDCATSVNQRGKIEKYQREGKPTPPGQVVDINGKTRTDTDQILIDLVKGTCALAPLGGVGDDMGGYKGYGYATVVEILSSCLQDGLTSPDLRGTDLETGKKIPMPLGHFFIAIDVEHFLPLKTFEQNTGNMLRRMRESRIDPNKEKIYTAGMLEYEAWLERSANGGTPVPYALQKDIYNLWIENKGDLQTKYPKLPFEFKPEQ